MDSGTGSFMLALFHAAASMIRWSILSSERGRKTEVDADAKAEYHRLGREQGKQGTATEVKQHKS